MKSALEEAVGAAVGGGPARRAGPPTPRARGLLGHLRDLRERPLDFLLESARTHGDLVRLRVPLSRSYLAAHPDDVQRVLQENHRNYTKDNIDYRVLKRVGGEGLLTSEGSQWLRQRRLMQPVFHRQRIAGFARLMTAAALEMLARWEAETVERCDLADEMMRLTLAIVGRALFSIDLAREAHAVGPAFTTVNRHLGQFNLMLLLPFLPTRANRRFRKAVAELDQVVWRVIGERRKSGADGEDRGDLLSMLLAARDADTGEGMSDRQLRDEIITLMLAGYETTANALTWTFYLLAQNADAERRLHEEVDAVLGARPPEADDLPRLVWTRMVIEEAMRLYPPAWIVTRGAIEDDELAGHRIAAGSIVMASPWVTHRHPDFWPEPERFDPERFSPERAAGRHRYAYFPFGGGPRLCIGSGFAMTEAQLILATVAQRHRFRLEPGYRATPEPLITLRPRGGMPVTVERRA